MPSNDAATTALITNEEVLEVNQHSHGGHQALDRGNLRVWVADGARPGEKYVALFNLGETAGDFSVGWSEVGISSHEMRCPRSYGAHKSLGPLSGLQVNLRAHASALYKVTTSREP